MQSLRFSLMDKILRDNRGLTLAEIMVVLVIIGLIATLVTTNVTRRLQKAKVDTTKAQIKNVENVLTQYELDNGSYPYTEQGLEALIGKPTVGKIPDNWAGPYIKGKLPADGWGNPFEYKCDDGRTYTITSFGADKKPGGGELDADISSDEL